MNDYDFSTLNDKEFENLTIDLISRNRDKRFERFKVGKDGGVDGRFCNADGTEEIVQCKHYLKTGYKGLISSLKKKDGNEADKVRKLNPLKYIFITSLPLGRKEKQEFRKIFDPYIKSDNDIYGQEDLNNLLKANPDIEENHYKLWISSTTVLQRIFNNAIKGRSEFLLEDIKDKIKYYIVTKNHNNAIKKLEESHTIIITGEPGIGKTTLAEQIALYYIEERFEFYLIADAISEAEAIFEKDKKQIFYFDDFLGSNYLNALEAHTDSHIMQFITRVKKDKDKRFILTSRTNIFNQSLLLSDKFRTKKLDSDEFIIKVDDLNEIDKANILYNHLWHSNLNEEYREELYKEERYKKIINHKNFNPRIIEFITDINRIKSVSAMNYWQDIQNSLNNPSEIWANTFDSQSDEFIRNIVALVVFNGNSIKESELKKSYNILNELTASQNYSHNNKEFDSVIKQTVKYFLNRKILSDGGIEYSLFNPSIADFIVYRYKEDKEKISSLLCSLNNLNSLKFLYSILSKEIYQEIIKTINTESLICGYKFIIKLIKKVERDLHDINIIIELVKFLEIENEEITNKLNILIYEYLIETLESKPIDNINDMIFEFNGYNSMLDEYDIRLDDDEIKNNICIKKLIEEIIYFDGMEIDEDDIIWDIDIENIKDQLIDEYINNGMNDTYYQDDENVISSSNNNKHKNIIVNQDKQTNNIDDLFQRS